MKEELIEADLKCVYCPQKARWRAVIEPEMNTEYLCFNDFDRLDEHGEIYHSERFGEMVFEEKEELVKHLNIYDRTQSYRRNPRP